VFGLKQLFTGHDDMRSVIAGINGGLKEQLVAGLSGSARTVFLASIYSETRQPLFIVTYNLLQAQKLYDDLIQLVDENEVFLYPANELIAAEMSVASPELKAQRIDVLNHWSRKKNGILIVPVSGLRKIIPPKSLWEKLQITLKVGEEIEVDQLLLKLVDMGYARSEMVTSPGEFSVRGGIIDIILLQNQIRFE